MFPNTALKSISPDVHVMQAFPNIFFLKQVAVGDSQGKRTLRSMGLFNLTPHQSRQQKGLRTVPDRQLNKNR
jgi:hypothetical protein